MFLLSRFGLTAEFLVEPMEEVVDALGSSDDVERRWTSSALLKEADPQFASRELPFHICAFLHGGVGGAGAGDMGGKRMKSKGWKTIGRNRN